MHLSVDLLHQCSQWVASCHRPAPVFTSAPSLVVFRSRFKTHLLLFLIPVPDHAIQIRKVYLIGDSELSAGYTSCSLFSILGCCISIRIIYCHILQLLTNNLHLIVLIVKMSNNVELLGASPLRSHHEPGTRTLGLGPWTTSLIGQYIRL